VITRAACEVYSKAFTVCVTAYLVILAAERLLHSVIPNETLRWATAFVIVQAVAIVALSLHLLVLRAYRQLKENIYEQIRPAIRDRVMALAFESESWSTGVPSRGVSRQVLEQSLAHALETLKASGRDRVARFALNRGFVAQWVKESSSRSKDVRKRAITLLGLTSPDAGKTALATAFHDRNPAVRIAACRAVLTSGDLAGAGDVFRLVLGESLLMRALLADDLKRRATYLLVNVIPPLLEKPPSLETARCFEMLIAWKRALPSFDIQPWLSGQRNQFLRPLVFGLLPYVPVDNSIEDRLASAIKSGELEAQCAAADAAGRLKRERLIPVLADALGREKRLALAAANAIAQMGEPGERYLEKIVVGPDRNAAAVALEALERVTVGLQ